MADKSGPVRRRNRSSLVCLRCKRRKIKCDRQNPCANCVKIGFPCSYSKTWVPTFQKGPKGIENGELSFTHFGLDSIPPPLTADGSSDSASSANGARHSPSEYLEHRRFTMQGDIYIVAPILLDNAGGKALNSNVGFLTKKYHDPRFPGLLPLEKTLCRLLPFELLVTKLAKNDYYGINPFENEEETIEFGVPFKRSTAGDGTIWDHGGIFTWKVVAKKSRWLCAVEEYVCLVATKESTDGLPADTAGAAAHPQLHTPHSAHGDTPRNPEMRQTTELLGLMLYDGDPHLELNLIERMRMMFPTKKAVWVLLGRYFQVLYPLGPFLDEMDFRATIARIIGAESYADEEVELHVASKIDVIHVACLLVVLRYSYVSLFPNCRSASQAMLTSDDPTLHEIQYLLKRPVDVNAIDVSHHCLHRFLLLRSINVPLFQLALLLRNYTNSAPESSYTNDGENIYSGLLHLMGYALGFHRDPSHFPGAVDPRTTNFIRKIWNNLCVIDVYRGYSSGVPISSNTEFFDTQFPTLDDGNENIKDKDLDKAVCKVDSISDALVYGTMKDLVMMCLSVRRPKVLSQLTGLLNRMESSTRGIFGSLRDYLQPLEAINATYSYGKLIKCFILLSLEVCFMTILRYVVAHYQEKKNGPLYSYYTKKIFYFAIEEILPLVPTLAADLEAVIGEGVSLFMNPALIDAVYRINEILLDAMMSSNNYLYKRSRASDHELRCQSDPDYHEHFMNLSQFVVLLERFSKLCLACLSVMSKRHYLAWRILKKHQHLLHAATDPKFYELVVLETELGVGDGPPSFTSAVLLELNEMCGRSFKFVEALINNSKEWPDKDIWGKTLRDEVPSILRMYKSQHHEQASARRATMDTSPAVSDILAADFSQGGFAAELDHDVFALNEIFNDELVDLLWTQMTSQKMQKDEERERLEWQAMFE